MSTIAPNTNPYVVANEAGKANTTDAEVKRLQIESAANAQQLLTSPNSPGSAALSTRQTTIQTNITNKDK